MDTAGKNGLDAIALGKTTLPIRFLGMGLYLAWLYSSHFSMALFPLSTDGGEVSLAFFVSNTICAATLIACALCANRLAPLTQRRATRWFSGLAAVAGTLLSAAHGALPFPPEAVIGLGSLLTGTATALLILMWSEFYANLPMRNVSIYYSASFILATGLYYATSLMSPLLAILVTAALPALSVAMLVKSMAILPTAGKGIGAETPEGAPGDRGGRWTFPLRPVLLMAAYSFAFNFVRQSDGGTTPFGMIGVGLIAAVVLVANAFFFKRFDTRLLYRLALPLMVAALLIQPLFGQGGLIVSDILANASYAGFVILTMIILSSICFRYGVTAIWLFGLTRAARVVANLVGAYVGKTSDFASAIPQPVLLVAIVVTLVTASMFLLNDQDFHSAWGIFPHRDDSTREKATLNYFETFLGRCAQVAREYGLTHREEEVLVLLAQGKTVPSIEKDLVISNSTAKSHVRHIYTKLGIHSRDELIDIVGMGRS